MSQYRRSEPNAFQDSSELKVKKIFFPVIVGTILLISGCDNASEYADSSADMEALQLRA